MTGRGLFDTLAKHPDAVHVLEDVEQLMNDKNALGVLRSAWTRPDILHIHSVGPALFTPLARAFGLRVVVTHHLANYENKKWGPAARLVLRLG